ncbi:MAG: galactose mutarotase [Rhodobacteraceae bacterium]|nr:galactose mutarotase [Paracoccaceae bacterium]
MADVGEDRLELRDGAVSVTLLRRGAITQDWRVPLGGERVPVILGYADPEAYRADRWFTGAIVGRVANRIGGARFDSGAGSVLLDANDGPHHLHGGRGGLWAVDWQMERLDARAVRLAHVSSPGTMGYPGEVRFEVTVRLEGFALSWDMRAEADRETPVSLAQHNYYALDIGGIGGQRLRIAADRALERDAAGIMTGALHAVGGGPLDFRAGRTLPPDGGRVDDFLVFEAGRDPALPVVELTARNGLRLRMWSDQPGAQVYAGHGMQPTPGGDPRRPLGPSAGLCLEPSGYPNAVNRPAFPDVSCGPGRPYRQRLTVEIAPF